jgi:PHD/YefM family antitoxin component YafN of YafNO toxin-antitoxin module
MADKSAIDGQPDLYARFRSCTSKQARDNLPALVDQVADTGNPVVIKKLNVGRAALIPARDLWLHEIIERLNMHRSSIEKPIEELMREVYERIELHLDGQPRAQAPGHVRRPAAAAPRADGGRFDGRTARGKG